jgi:hypothetical protein
MPIFRPAEDHVRGSGQSAVLPEDVGFLRGLLETPFRFLPRLLVRFLELGLPDGLAKPHLVDVGAPKSMPWVHR